jgi:predicted RNase H-like HicB family nuclease
MRQILLTPGEDGGWVATVPSLPGAISEGETREEALRNIREAIDLVEAVTRHHSAYRLVSCW